MMKTGDGMICFGGWQSIRRAIDSAYADLGITRPDSVPVETWNLVGLAIEHDRVASQPSCFECERVLSPGSDIRCLDCKMVFCEHCATKHFWPNGRSGASE